MCRHHIVEIVIKGVYHALFASDTPNNLFFPILKKFPFTPFDENSLMEDMDDLDETVVLSIEK